MFPNDLRLTTYDLQLKLTTHDLRPMKKLKKVKKLKKRCTRKFSNPPPQADGRSTCLHLIRGLALSGQKLPPLMCAQIFDPPPPPPPG